MDTIPDLQGNSGDIVFGQAPELSGFIGIGQAECELAMKVEGLYKKGKEFVYLMYGARSLGLAIPEQGPRLLETTIEKIEVELFKPEMIQIKKLMSYVVTAIDAVIEVTVRLATLYAGDGGPMQVGLQLMALRLLDVLFVIDNMKDLRTSYKIDFTRFKPAFVRLGLSIEDLTEMQAFLCNQDPKKACNYILWTVRESMIKIKGSDRVLSAMLNQVLDQIDQRIYMLPDERMGLIRMIPHLMVLMDGEVNDPKSFNVFQGNSGSGFSFDTSAMGGKRGSASTGVVISSSALQKVLKRFPVVPLYADVTLVLVNVLERAPHFNRVQLGDAWGANAAAKDKAEVCTAIR